MAEAHTAAALHVQIIPQPPVTLDITTRMEYGSEAGSDFNART
jgi:hypothetical protein